MAGWSAAVGLTHVVVVRAGLGQGEGIKAENALMAKKVLERGGEIAKKKKTSSTQK